MENIRLKKENSILEKKKKELLNQIHELMAKNNTLNEEILSLKYSNKEINFSKVSNNNNNMITELNKTISSLKEKINQITKEKDDLEKINNDLQISINSYKTEKQKQLKESNSRNNILSDMKKMNEILNKNYTAAENEKKSLKKTIQELTEQNNKINNELSEMKKENDLLNQKITDINIIKEEYQEKYNKISKELSDEKDINIFNEQKIKILERKMEEYHINEFDEAKTKTYKISKINKVNEIEMEKLSKKFYNSPYYHKNTSTFSTNSTTNKILLINNLEELEISPENYTIIKQFKLTNNLKWYLLKKIKKNSGMKEENSTSPKPGYKQPSRRFKYFKLNSKTNNNMYNDDSYSDFVWKSNKNEKEFINFNTDLLDTELNDNSTNKENQKKIIELESYIKELEEKLEKKESDCNRINLNYAKLFKRAKMPENNYDKLLENIDKLKEENKNLVKQIENLKLNQKFIGLSFIEDDLEGSRFIDDNGIEEILDELCKNKDDKKNGFNSTINMMKFFRSHEDDKDKNRGKNLTYKNDKKYIYYKRDTSNKNVFDEKNKLKTENNEEINDENKIQIKAVVNKEHTNYFDKNIISPNKYNNNNTVENRKTDNKKITINTCNNNDDNNKNKENNEISSNTSRFRRTFKKCLNINNNLEYNNINEKNNAVSPKNQIKENINNKFLITVNTIKIDDDENKNCVKRIETLQEDTIKVNRFQRMRRFYKKRQGDSKSINKEK